MMTGPDSQGFRTVQIVGGPQLAEFAPDVESQRPLTQDPTYQRALARASKILAEKARQEDLDRSRKEWLTQLPHTD